MTKQIDFARINKDELQALLRAQVQRVTGLQTEDTVLKVEIEKDRLPALDLTIANEPAVGIPDSRSKQDIEAAMPGPLANIKPNWRTKNRLQNCHQPKQK